MPLYKYHCINCGAIEYQKRKMEDRDEGFKCKKCWGKMERIFNSKPLVRYLSDGFYSTDKKDSEE